MRSCLADARVYGGSDDATMTNVMFGVQRRDAVNERFSTFEPLILPEDPEHCLFATARRLPLR